MSNCKKSETWRGQWWAANVDNFRSVVSKSVSLKVYQKREQSRSVTKPQKIDTIKEIEKSFGVSEGTLDGLINAKGETLKHLFKLVAENFG